MVSPSLRGQVEGLLQTGDARGADALLRQAWRAQADSATASFLVAAYEKIREALPLTPYRLAILRSYTIEPLTPLLRAEAFAAGIDLAIYTGEFNVWLQEALAPESELYAFKPDAIVLAIHDAVTDSLRDCIEAIRRNSSAAVIVHTQEGPRSPRRGILDAQTAGSDWERTQTLNTAIRELARAHRGVYVLDYDALTARHGRQAWRDERKWMTVRLPIAAPYLRHMVLEWMRFLHPLTGKIAKAIAVDLDNTLWGGIVGEDGIEGLRLGSEYPGAAFQAVQQALLDLRDRGILLAVCSKNNPDDAIAAIEQHPGMLLRMRDFSAVRINWNDKAQNLREIARELNIGIDAIAFLDDNPVERDAVRASLPDVCVIDLPAEVISWPQVLRDQPAFERLTLSAEDARRGEYYAAQRERQHLEASFKTPVDFLRSLEQEAEISTLDSMNLARIAQLTQKTNQFNLTTRRYSEQQISELSRRPGCQIYALRVRDRFGDNGIVGVAITTQEGDTGEIDTFLLSCRVIGRGVETALLSFLCDQIAKNGGRKIRGQFLGTKKNSPCRTFFADHGFEQVSGDESGSVWELNLAAGTRVESPDWIRVSTLVEARG